MVGFKHLKISVEQERSLNSFRQPGGNWHVDLYEHEIDILNKLSQQIKNGSQQAENWENSVPNAQKYEINFSVSEWV